MSDRSLDILQQLIKQRSIQETELSKMFDLSARQLSYSIDAINEKLMENQLPVIEKRQGAITRKMKRQNT